jgi:hypothetical protein
MGVGDADHLIVALGGDQCAHHGIFGDSMRVDAAAVGDAGALRAELVLVERIEPGIDRRQPLEFAPRGDGARPIGGTVIVDPADIGIGDHFDRLVEAGEPVHVQPPGQPRLDQRASERGEDGLHQAKRRA